MQTLQRLHNSSRPRHLHNPAMDTSGHKQQQPLTPQIRNLPWVEKYWPQTQNDLSHQNIVSTIKKCISEDQFLFGPPGTGTIPTILAWVKQLYKDKDFNSMVLKLSAPDNQRIGVIQGINLSFASTRTIFQKGFKLMILDEADAMTKDAQDALGRVTEKFTKNTRSCLICNYLSKIIPSLQSCSIRF